MTIPLSLELLFIALLLAAMLGGTVTLLVASACKVAQQSDVIEAEWEPAPERLDIRA